MLRSLLPLCFLVIPLPSWAQEECFPLDVETFNSSVGWTHEGLQPDVDISGGAMVWNDAAASVYDRLWRPLAYTLPDACFTAWFTFTVAPNFAGNGPGANLFALSAGSLDVLSYDASQSYALTDQDGLVVVVSSTSPNDNDIDNWHVGIQEKDGTDRYYPPVSEWIYLDSSIDTYYAVLQRSSATETHLRIYLDANHTILHGSLDFTIHSTVTGLNTVQAGVTTFGSIERHYNGTMDDIAICSCVNVVGVNETGNVDAVPVVRQDGLAVQISLAAPGTYRVAIMDAAGRLHADRSVVGNEGLRTVLAPGLYTTLITTSDRQVSTRFVAQ